MLAARARSQLGVGAHCRAGSRRESPKPVLLEMERFVTRGSTDFSPTDTRFEEATQSTSQVLPPSRDLRNRLEAALAEEEAAVKAKDFALAGEKKAQVDTLQAEKNADTAAFELVYRAYLDALRGLQGATAGREYAVAEEWQTIVTALEHRLKDHFASENERQQAEKLKQQEEKAAAKVRQQAAAAAASAGGDGTSIRTARSFFQPPKEHSSNRERKVKTYAVSVGETGEGGWRWGFGGDQVTWGTKHACLHRPTKT